VLPAPARRDNGYRDNGYRDNGYRDYADVDLARLRLVVTLRRLGLGPEDAGRLARLCLEHAVIDTNLAPLLAEHHEAIARQRADLDRLEGELADLEMTIVAAGRARRRRPVSDSPIRVLFVGTHNSARSQVAEALLCDDGGDDFEVFSAGTEVTRVNPFAVRVLTERSTWAAGLPNAIPHPSNGLDEPGGRRVVSELAADVGHVDVNEVVVGDEPDSPHLVQEPRPRYNDARLTCEHGEEVELECGQLDCLVVHAHQPSAFVDLQPLGPGAGPRGWDRAGSCARVGARPAKQGLQASDEFAWREWLGEIVVGADSEPDDPVDLLAACRQHQDVCVGEGPHLPAHLDAVHARQHQVEHDSVRLGLADQLERHRAVARLLNQPALPLEVAGHELHDGFFVIDDKDSRRVRGDRRVTPTSLRRGCIGVRRRGWSGCHHVRNGSRPCRARGS